MKQILSFTRMELFFSIRRNGFRIYYILFAALMFLFVNITGGAFPGVQVSGDNFKINAPFFVDTVIAATSLLTTFAVASFAGMGALRDFNYNSYSITFSYPVSRRQYILGKFAGIYLAGLLLYTALLLGYALACEMPWLHRNSFYPFSFSTYWNVFYQKIAVNLFFLTAAFFTLGLLVRNVVINWIAIIAFYILYYLASRYFRETGTRTLGALLDPYGLISTIAVSVGQGAEERNTSPVDLHGLYLLNRLIWMGAGILFLLLAVIRFRFRYDNGIAFLKSAARKRAAEKETAGIPVAKPAYTLRHDAFYTVNVFFNQLRMECRHIGRSIYFYLILITAAVFLYFSSRLVGKVWETSSYPTTINAAEILSGAVHIFIILLLLVYGGESVWRDRHYRLQGIISATPAPCIARFLAKTAAMYLLVLIMMSMVLVAGLLLQVSQGYHDYEFSLYFTYLFGYQGVQYLFYCVAVIALQSLAANRFQGYFAFAVLYIFSNFIAYSLFRHGIFTPGHTPDVSYSDLTDFQGSFYPFLVFSLYWVLFAILLWRAGVRSFPQHEQQESYRERIRMLAAKGIRRSKMSRVILAGFIALGVCIFYNTDILNTRHSEKYYNRLKADYEKKYKHLEREPQPTVVHVKGSIDLYTAQRKMNAAMQLVLKNKTSKAVHNIYFNLSDEKYYSNWHSSIAWQQILHDKQQNLFGYRLQQPLNPGDSLELSYDFRFAAAGFTDEGISSIVNRNGTFINSENFLPVIGYTSAGELTGNDIRKEYGLAPRPYAPLPTDSMALNDNMLGHGADRIGLTLTISTTKGQTAIAPGYLVKQWDKNDRSYFTYAMAQPVVNYFSIQSGNYRHITENYSVPGDTTGRTVQLSVYYHPKHAYNINVMMQAMKDVLDYYTAAFGPYQYRQLRIVEFPAASFAQSYANTIPFSENIGFLADLRKTDDTAAGSSPVDYVYYVTAHEVAHQWWAHQVLPANVEGFNFLCESLSQYSAAMMMKHKYGERKVRKFLEMESFKYLSSRGSERLEERPLSRVLGEQQYVFYNKGIGAMYALQHYLGEETVNTVLRHFVHSYAYRERPYVTAATLVSLLRTAAPDSVRYIVDDCLQRIVIYDNKVKSAAYSLNEETLEYTVDAVITGKKLVYNEKGKEHEAAMNDYITLGIFNTSGREIASRRLRIRSGENHIHFTTPRRPAALMLNPDYDLEEKAYDAGDRKVDVVKLQQ